ncbi:MAG: type II toxin-antitoxin system VapC family toxin [Armatimonadetes bacterium]|nr:type II toxin-antitoxin system VapC family toxin [Armatimonadota bacterium]
MITPGDRVVLDTNIRVFGLRAHPEKPACAALLDRLRAFRVVLPRQVLRELQVNLAPAEMRMLFALLRQLPTRAEIHWEMVKSETIRRYQELGCKMGDAVIAAHLDELGVRVLISENRHFLSEIEGLPFQTLSAEDALAELDDGSA